jgi:hypothetical protein
MTRWSQDGTSVGLIAVGVPMATVGLTVFIASDSVGKVAGVFLWAIGLGLYFGSFAHHDRWHRRRGEAPDALWGLNDRNRPRWAGPRRRR